YVPTSIGGLETSRGIVVQTVPGPQSRSLLHRSMQWPRSHVLFRQSPFTEHVAPAGLPLCSSTQLAIRCCSASSIPSSVKLHANPATQSTSLVHRSPSCPVAT